MKYFIYYLLSVFNLFYTFNLRYIVNYTNLTCIAVLQIILCPLGNKQLGMCFRIMFNVTNHVKLHNPLNCHEIKLFYLNFTDCGYCIEERITGYTLMGYCQRLALVILTVICHQVTTCNSYQLLSDYMLKHIININSCNKNKQFLGVYTVSAILSYILISQNFSRICSLAKLVCGLCSIMFMQYKNTRAQFVIKC